MAETELPKRQMPSVLTVSDWITFLSSEKHGTMSSWLNSYAIIMAVLVFLYSFEKNPWILLFIAFVIVAAVIVISRYSNRQGGVAEKLLDDIMSGSLIDEPSIRVAWLERTKGKK
jgi:signal transduction histidine kinase